MYTTHRILRGMLLWSSWKYFRFFFVNFLLATLVRSIKTNEYSNLGSTPSLIFFFMLSKHAFEDLVQFPGNIWYLIRINLVCLSTGKPIRMFTFSTHPLLQVLFIQNSIKNIFFSNLFVITEAHKKTCILKGTLNGRFWVPIFFAKYVGPT